MGIHPPRHPRRVVAGIHPKGLQDGCPITHVGHDGILSMKLTVGGLILIWSMYETSAYSSS